MRIVLDSLHAALWLNSEVTVADSQIRGEFDMVLQIILESML